METVIVVLITVGILIWVIAAFLAPNTDSTAAEEQETTAEENTGPDLNKIARRLEDPFENMAHPGDALNNTLFKDGVSALSSDAYDVSQVRNYALGSNWVLQCIGLEALASRDDSASLVKSVRTRLSSSWAWPLYFAIRFIDAKSTEPEIGNILMSTQYWWPENPMICEEIGAVFKKRLAGGEKPVLTSRYDSLDTESRQSIDKFVSALPDDIQQPLRNVLATRARAAVDHEFLRSIGELLVRDRITEPVFENAQLRSLFDECTAELAEEEHRSILIVGEPGVGKTALRRWFARHLLDDGWQILKTSATRMIADKKYVGEIEGQIQKLSENATAAKHVAVYIDRLEELDQFGRHVNKSTSVLDQLWPMIESGKLFFVSETTPAGLQTLLKRFPTLPTALKIIKLNAADENTTSAMAEALLEQNNPGT